MTPVALVLILERMAYLPHATFGRLRLPGGAVVYTVERPWKGNQVRVSCIPEGVYQLKRGRFHRGGYDTWEVQDVPGRSLIKFHKANLASELAGCIAPGLELGVIRGEWAVVNSAAGFRLLMEALGGSDDVRLQINQYRPQNGNQEPRGLL